ncbi:hypothetical protein CK203_095408 [Vitis vinifera]|uniref:Uncharacterized protein n=1 Tax=Vitis vinifera TaxID=29760 RepID=A0A438CW33_VITVI|nr:hypothetical protein CK203_095408 [Vitis vinifera]
MRKQDSTLRGGRSTTQNKLIKGTDSLFLNSEIGFGYTCEKKDFQHKGDDLRTNPFQDEGNDEDTTNKWNANPIQVPVGLITRAQAKKFKETLNGLILNIWAEVNLWRPKEDTLHIPQGWISMIQALE